MNTNINNDIQNPIAHSSTSPSAAARTAETTNGNANASSGFSLPASNPFTDHNDPLNPFSPAHTPMATPLGSPTSELRKLNLGVERYARAIEDNGPIGSFSGVVPLPSLSQSHPIASKRRPSHILLDKLSPIPSNDPSMLSPHQDGTAAEATGRSTGLNLNSIKRAISGKKRLQDMNMTDLESNSYASSSQHDANATSNSNNLNHRRGSLFQDLSNPFANSTSNSNMDAQVALMESLSYSPQPMLLPTMPSPTVLHEAPNESRTSGSGGDDIRRRLEQSNSKLSTEAAVGTKADPTIMIDVDSDATISPGMRRRKPKGGILSQLLKLQRNEAAAAAAASSSSTANSSGSRRSATQPGSVLHAAVKKTKKGFYYRSSSKNNSSADLASPSVTTTPKVSPRNSRVFDLDPLAPMATITRLPTQPSTSINNNASPFARPTPQHHHENMEEMEAISAAATAATLNANLGIQRDIAEILTRQSFLIMIAKALILYGAPSHRIEETCALLARKMEVDASFALLPGLMTISFSDPETHTSDTRHLRCTQGMDMYKLSKVYKIAWGVLHGKGVEEANRALERVTIEPGYYPVWVTVMSWMTTAAFVAPLAFNGSWLDTALAGLCGLIVGLLGVVAAKFPVYGNVFEVTSSILVGFIARSFGDRVCFAAVALAGVVILLPGLLLTQSIMELASRNIVSGSVRMFYALMYAFFLGYGLSLGAELWIFVSRDHSQPSEDVCKHGVDHWWFFLIFPAVSTSINIVFNAHPCQWLGMTLVTAVGYTVSYFMTAGPQVSPAIAAFAVGIAGQAYGRITGNLSYVPLLSGVLLLVPGSVGVRGVLAFIGTDPTQGDPSQGFQFALSMVNIAVSITLGVFCSALVWYPFWRKSTFMNF
ncbi:hypothetical protein EC957_011386 [Mortierella hygrophila]|uniref:Pheromone-regulated membrane protein 10 n=1 Tax=Mortierella hygrophila TaxID=979708 RepID=A0A9P6FGL0_9FUNG|nr:hypothetical protein EC957_011386 [Mortierella hygrophila]